MKKQMENIVDGVTLCVECGHVVPDARLCLFCGAILDERLRELTSCVSGKS